MSAPPRRRVLRQNRILWLLDRLEREPRADAPIDTLRRGVRALPLGRGRDLLHGRWLGHPVHPLMVQVPIGSWLSAAVLDLRPGRSRESGLLVGVGLGAAAPRGRGRLGGGLGGTAPPPAAGRAGARPVEHGGRRPVRRLARQPGQGREGAGRAYGFLGLTAVGVGGMLGGHLAYRQASGANHAEEVPHVVSAGWHRIGSRRRVPRR